MFQVKTIEDIPVAYVVKQGHPSLVAGRAFWELEQKVPLRGNKFYGVFDERKNEYRACAALNDSNQGVTKGLERGVIPGGSYACATLVGSYHDIVRQIAPTFEVLAEKYRRDPARLPVEFYKRHTEVVVMLPITAR